jgi:tetratricopeptide (TPR) repeat protein
MFVEARMHRDVVATEVIDQDAAVEATIGLIRSKAPRPDMAAARLAEILKADPSNADAHLLKIELLRRLDAKGDALPVAIDEALAAAPVPELFHEAVGFHLARNARNKAIKVLETAVETFPDQSRLRTRLAALLLRAGRRPEAMDHLRQAMDLDPMLPDAYGLLGMARREEGAERLDEAETLLREAVRLAPGDVVQTSRLVWLLLDIAKGVPERAEAARAEVKELLDALLQSDKRSWEGHLLYAVTLRESGGDLDRAKWMLKQARKLAPPGKGGPLARFDVEEALLELSEGKAEAAEERLRRVSRKDPSNARVFAALAKALEARGQYVAAHAELHRAAERTAPGSLDRQAMDMDLARLRALIEAGAGVMAASVAPSAAAPEAAPEEPASADEPWADEPAAEESAADEPAAEESAPEESAADDGLADEGFASAPPSDDWDA